MGDTSGKAKEVARTFRSRGHFWIDPEENFLRCVYAVAPATLSELWVIVMRHDFAELGEEDLAEIELKRALADWAIRWSLTASWCGEKAYGLLTGASRYWGDTLTFSFECIGWTPGRDDQAVAVKRIRDAFEDALRRHLAEMESQARSLGRLHPADKRNSAHFLWAARFQVGGESYTDIAKSVGVSTTDARKEILKILNLIGLTPRTVRRGPQKKSAP